MRSERRKAAWLGLVPGLVAVFIPKCPMCIATYLSLAGIGIGAATTLAPFLRPAGLVIAGVSVLVIAWTRLRHHLG